MALTPNDEIHALQIQAGILGRKTGHAFEDQITDKINNFVYPRLISTHQPHHLCIGDPATLLLDYVAKSLGATTVYSARALSTGALATSEEGKKWLEHNGVPIRRCKSDLLLTLATNVADERTVGISTKQCNNKTPTNAQLYFTTARGFSKLLQENGLPVSNDAVIAMRQFCGDAGYAPRDAMPPLIGRLIDPRRFFWEEINPIGRQEWEKLFSERQDAITRLLLQKAYLDDPFTPDFLIHKTKKAPSWEKTEVAIYTVDELILHSKMYSGYTVKPYSVRKGSYKDPTGITHLAPRFGIVQMQRGGQAQHPEQLQFNLEAGYFYKIKQSRNST
jgi:hypothetical protein